MAGENTVFNDTIEMLFRSFNEPVIPKGSIERWLRRFDDEDKLAAITLLKHVEYHSQPRVMRETRLLHQKVLQRLAISGFDWRTLYDVDFSREFTCKSGDVVSYIYRKSNLIPTVDFKTFDELTEETMDHSDRFKTRALVILDDYIGTGSQFIFQFIGRSDEDIRVVNSYGKTYLVCYVIHEKALRNFQRLAEGRIDEVIRIEKEQFPDVDFSLEEERLHIALTSLDWQNIELVYLEAEEPLLSPHNRTLGDEEKGRIERLLNKYKHEGYAGTSYLLGHHAFFFGAPNSLPEILWPLFNRIEDISIYSEKLVAFKEDVIRYSIDEEG